MSDKSAACKFISSKTVVVPKPGKFPDVDNAPVKSDTSGTDNIEDQKYQKDAADLMKQAIQLTKVADEGQAVDAPLGSMQQAYVADAVGADARSRAAKQIMDHEDVDEGLYNSLLSQTAGMEHPFYKRVRHGASGFAESSRKRMLNRLDPSQLITEDPDATVTGLLMGTGKANPEREELVAQRYKEVLKKYQDKLDPDAELTERDTPWHRYWQGVMADLDSDIAGHKYMRAEKPWQYWLNPFDKSGPLTELQDRGMRRMRAAQAYPDSTAGRLGMGLGSVGTLGLLPLITGGEDAQQSLRRSAAENKIYSDVADPELKKPRDGDGDGKINDGTPEEKEAQILVPSLRGLKQAAWYDYLNPINYALPGGPSQVGAERDRGNKLDAEIAKQQKAKMPKKPAAKASVEGVNRQIDKGGLTAGSFRR